jgi:hypothetical protein
MYITYSYDNFILQMKTHTYMYVIILYNFKLICSFLVAINKIA